MSDERAFMRKQDSQYVHLFEQAFEKVGAGTNAKLEDVRFLCRFDNPKTIPFIKALLNDNELPAESPAADLPVFGSTTKERIREALIALNEEAAAEELGRLRDPIVVSFRVSGLIDVYEQRAYSPAN